MPHSDCKAEKSHPGATMQGAGRPFPPLPPSQETVINVRERDEVVVAAAFRLRFSDGIFHAG